MWQSSNNGLGRNQLWPKASKVVDIVIHNDIVYVQFEVESKLNREATVRKLSFGWSDQLRFLNNRDQHWILCSRRAWVSGEGDMHMEK